MILTLLEMKFKAFVLMTISFACLMVIINIKWSMDWMLGWTPPEPPHLKETLEETLARELNQVSEGWTGSPTYPRIPILVWWQPFTGDDGLQTCGEHQCYVTNDRTFRNHPMLSALLRIRLSAIRPPPASEEGRGLGGVPRGEPQEQPHILPCCPH